MFALANTTKYANLATLQNADTYKKSHFALVCESHKSALRQQNTTIKNIRPRPRGSPTETFWIRQSQICQLA